MTEPRESRVVTIGGVDYTFTEPSWIEADRALALALTIMERSDEFVSANGAAVRDALVEYAAKGGDVSNVDAMKADQGFLLMVGLRTMSAIRGLAASLVGNLARHAEEVTELLCLTTGLEAECFTDLSRADVGALLNEAVGTLPFGSALEQGSNLISTFIVALRSKSDEDSEKPAASAPASDGGQSILKGMECDSPAGSSGPPNTETLTS